MDFRISIALISVVAIFAATPATAQTSANCQTLFKPVATGQLVTEACDSLALITPAAFRLFVERSVAAKDAQFQIYKAAVGKQRNAVGALIDLYERQLALSKSKSDTLEVEITRLRAFQDSQATARISELTAISTHIESAARHTAHLQAELAAFQAQLILTEKAQRRQVRIATIKGGLVVGLPLLTAVAILAGAL